MDGATTEASGRERGASKAERWTHVALAAIVLGAVARLIFAIVIHPPHEYLFSDMGGYATRAFRVVTGEPLMRYDAFYPPGTHLLLAAPLKLFGADDAGLRGGDVLWWALSSAVPLFAWLMARRLLSPAAAAVTAVLCAAYPLFVLYAGFFTSETPALAFLLAGLWLIYRARQSAGRAAVVSAAAAGLLGAVAVSNRPQFVLNLAVAGLPLLWAWRSHWRPAAALVAAGAVTLAPVIAYNSAAADGLTGISENGGLNFFQSHCNAHLVTAGSPETGGEFAFGSPVPFELNEGIDYSFPDRQVWDQGFFYDQGWSCIRRDGLDHASRLLGNVVDAGARATPFPLGDPPGQKTLARAANLAYSIALPLLVVASLLLLLGRQVGDRDRGGRRELLLQLACLLPVLLFYDSEPRFRIPYDVFGLALLASLASEAVGRLWRRRAKGIA